jgi:hypothetical protein
VKRWLPVALVAFLAGGLTWLNRGERVILHAGFATFYRAPLTVVLFASFVAGMLSMLALSLRHDRRMRDELRARGLLDEPAGARRASSGGTRPHPVAHAEPLPAAADHARYSDPSVDASPYSGVGNGSRDGDSVEGWRPAPPSADGQRWPARDETLASPGEDDRTLLHPRDPDPPVH